MAGRGRGKLSMSFNTEQLGFTKGEVSQPPSSYPLLEHRPLPITLTNEMSYLVELKKDFAEYMRESPNNVLPIIQKKDIERFSDRYQDIVTDKLEYQSKYDWSRMPTELKLSQKRKIKLQKTMKMRKKQKVVDVEKKLAELEKKEDIQQNGTEENGKEVEEEDVEEEEAEEHPEDEEKVDEEMDDGTDYMNNYFDNGEGYEEDENIDDEPVY